jgi:acyl carrier protein
MPHISPRQQVKLSVPTNRQTRDDIKRLVVESLHLEGLSPEEIGDDQPLFEGGLGLDSIDALELLVGLERTFQIKIPTSEAGPETFASVSTLAELVEKCKAAAHVVQR